jgi:hypothetical protein
MLRLAPEPRESVCPGYIDELRESLYVTGYGSELCACTQEDATRGRLSLLQVLVVQHLRTALCSTVSFYMVLMAYFSDDYLLEVHHIDFQIHLKLK